MNFKRSIKALALSVVALVALLVVSALAISTRERKIATSRANEFVQSLASDSAQRRRFSIPEDVAGAKFALKDSDLFERTWMFWFEIEGQGVIEVQIYAPSGIPFFPFLNSRDDLELLSADYIAPHSRRKSPHTRTHPARWSNESLQEPAEIRRS